MTRRAVWAAVGLVVMGGAASALALAAPQLSFIRSDRADRIPITTLNQTVQHLPTPPVVKGLYMTQCVAGMPALRADLVNLVERTDLNALVIDIKDYSGDIAFPSENQLLKPFVSTRCGAIDMKSFIKSLHEKGIYVIGRITVFQDPLYAKTFPDQAVQRAGGGVWHDYKGLAFIDVGARGYWDYIIELSRESYAIGFDELNYDYIRYPSDGPMKEAVYAHSASASKEEVLEEFFRYLSRNLRPLGVTLSADLFGYTTVHTDDLGIGQILERALPYFDYIDPMVYPSHYNSGFADLKNVNSDPYKVVYTSLSTAVQRTRATTTQNYSFVVSPIASTSPQLYEKPPYNAEKIRPWLQAFDYPIPYTPAMIEAQIKATEDAGLQSYLFWDASNKYTNLRKILPVTSVP